MTERDFFAVRADVYRQPCKKCGVPMTVLFQLPVCENVWCGKYSRCCDIPMPYITKVTSCNMMGVTSERLATFCRSCGRELRAID